MQAAVLRIKAPHLYAWTEARRLNASRYIRLFREADVDGRVILPTEPREPSAYLQSVRHPYSPIAMVSSVTWTSVGSATKSTTRCRSICSHASPISATAPASFLKPSGRARETLAIPIFGELTLDEQRLIVETIAEFVKAPDRTAARADVGA